MNRSNGANIRILTVWLLLLFALPPAVKAIHICHCVYAGNMTDGNAKHAHHDCNTCAVCQFVLFPFTETERAGIICLEQTVCSQPSTYCENIGFPVIYSYMLRAPPSHDFRYVRDEEQQFPHLRR